MTQGQLVDRVQELCAQARARLPESETRTLVEAVESRLAEPLRVAVAGRVKAGKSTLVNALLGQKVATVDVGECTRVITWYRYAAQQRVEVVRHDGSSTFLALAPDGSLPLTLGTPIEEVRRLVVWLSNDRLRDLTVIDTPGLESVNESYSEVTEAFLATDAEGAGVAEADALVFLMPTLRDSDRVTLLRFRNLSASLGLSSVNTVGVLSKVDKLADADQDPWPVAARLADRMSHHLRDLVSKVVPVVGLLGETACTDDFSEADAAAVVALAGIDPLDREDLLISAATFAEVDAPVSADQRRRLLQLLDLYGMAQLFGLVDEGAAGAVAMLDHLRACSGIAPLQGLVADDLAGRADALKALGALGDLDRISYRRDPGVDRALLLELRSGVERLQLEPAMHQVREMALLQRIAREPDLDLPAELLADVERLARATTTAERLGTEPDVSTEEMTVAAREAAGRWSRFENDPRTSPGAVRIAREVRDSFAGAYAELRPDLPVVAQ